MARSDSSDSERDRKRNKSKKRSRHRSRSCSSDRNHKSKSRKLDSRDRKRSRSRERRSSRSHSRDGSYKRRERSKSRSRDNDKKYRSKRYSSDDNSDSSYSQSRSKKIDSRSLEKKSDEVTLKEKVKALVVQNEQIIPSFEQIAKIEGDSFVQEHFSKTYNQPNIAQTKSKKKKKNKQKQNKLQEESKNENIVQNNISHESAIFGTTLEIQHVDQFSSRINNKRKEELKSIETDDLIFGAMFYEKPEIRMKRWVEKLKILRKRLCEESYKTMQI